MRTFLRALAPTHGRGMVYVWALEQSKDSRRHAPGEDLERGETGEQDVFVPWVLSKEAPKSTKEALAGVKREKVRRPQKTKKASAAATGTGDVAGPSPPPSLPEDGQQTQTGSPVDVLTENLAVLPLAMSTSSSTTSPPPRPTTPPKVYQRYYHLFRGSELVDLVAAAAEAEGLLFVPLVPAPADESPEARTTREKREAAERRGRAWVRVQESFWEKDNWVCILQRGRS
jgi:hypothetical protein